MVIALVLAFVAGTCSAPTGRCDHVITTDTIHAPIPEPIKVQTTKFVVVPVYKPSEALLSDDISKVVQDTTRLDKVVLKGDSVQIPILSKTYVTKDYTATVTGWRPELADIKIHTKTVTKRPRFAITAGATSTYDGSRLVHGVGVTAGVVLWSK